MALTLILLVGSGLLLRSFQSLRDRDPGFGNPEEVLALSLTVPSGEVEDRAAAALVHERIARRLGEIPGVTSVGLSSDIPMHDGGNVNPFYADGFSPTGDRPPPLRRHKWIGEGYFETLEIPLIVGRTFTWADVRDRFPGAIISESLAREYWGSPQAALGQRVSARPEPVRWHEVIGVAPDVREDGIRLDHVALVYWPQVTLAFWEGSPADQVQSWRTMAYSIRSDRTGSPALFADVREAVWEVNPNLPLRSVQTLSDLIALSMAETSFSALLLGLSAGVALILGLVGVYGVISYSVSQRSRELGMRIALGASSSDIVAMVLRQALTLSAIGIGVGIIAALALSRFIAGLLFGVSPMDPVTWTVVPIGLLLVALLASHLPARRAAHVDPMAAIRAE